MKRPTYPVTYLLIALIIMAAVHYLLPITQLIPEPYPWLGLLPAAIGITILGRSILQFRRAGTTVEPFQKANELVQNGLYAYSRNPIYLAMVLCLIGIAILLGSLTPFLVIPLFAWIIQRNVITAEEQMLESTFGNSYRQYKQRVRRWL
jgi:protein-S-isoprenylcysteine O-methyltransferase Ste14